MPPEPDTPPLPHTRLRCSLGPSSHARPRGGRRPEKPTAIDAGFYQWGGVPNFGTLGIVPKRGDPLGSPAADLEASELSKLGCTPRTNETTPANLWGGDWDCPHLHMASVDLSNYMPVAQVKSLRRFFWGSSAGGDEVTPQLPFELRAYYFVKPPWCPCSGSSLIGVTADIERLLLDNIEPFVGSSCADIRARVDGMSVNYFNWQECCRGFKISIFGGALWLPTAS